MDTQVNAGREQLFSHGNQLFDCLLKDLAKAKHRIDFETYIFNNDSLGQRVSEALIAAAHRGVKVRVMVDGIGTPRFAKSFAKPLENAGIETRVFHPFPWQIRNWRRAAVRVPKIMKWLYLFFMANSRNHRKVCVIDQTIAYVGSMNVTVNHLDQAHGGRNWRDTTLRIESHELQPLTDAFERAWFARKPKERLRDSFRYVIKNPYFRLNDSRHRRRVLHKYLLKIMRRARKRIWITNAYFVPDNFLLKALKDAANVGVDVRILLPKKSNWFFMPWASSSFYYSLLKAGVRIFQYVPSMLHAKTLIIDDWMTVGSTNLNHRSLLHDLEVDVNIREPETKAALVENFKQDLKQSEEVTLLDMRKRSWRQRMMGRIFLYLKYWI